MNKYFTGTSQYFNEMAVISRFWNQRTSKIEIMIYGGQAIRKFPDRYEQKTENFLEQTF